ncbi:MAG TPA: UPF0182 family protein, partial [bacterium]|nr:UPF0182 family protein [bacterium]
MYGFIIFIILILIAWMIRHGVRHRQSGYIAAGIGLGILTVLFFRFMEFLSEMLWFQNLGYNPRFWTVVIARVACAAAGGLLGWLIPFLLTLAVPASRKWIR